ncbi:hypothetical protein D3C76_680940 [compost metagenome]
MGNCQSMQHQLLQVPKTADRFPKLLYIAQIHSGLAAHFYFYRPYAELLHHYTFYHPCSRITAFPHFLLSLSKLLQNTSFSYVVDMLDKIVAKIHLLRLNLDFVAP